MRSIGFHCRKALRFAHRGVAIACVVVAPLRAQPSPEAPVPLWPRGAPGAPVHGGAIETVEDGYVRAVAQPSLTLFRADPGHANGAAIIIAPGGGHRMLVAQNEGVVPARALNRYGITTLVLHYRLARAPGSTVDVARDAAADARRAVRWVRAHAAALGIDPHRVGLMGFSAGGELVGLVADAPHPAAEQPTDAIDRESARPDFQVLIYPGPGAVPKTLASDAPPAFLAAGTLDACCGTAALALYQQLRAARVSAELHMYADADHGFNLAMHSERLSLQHWPDHLIDWLSDGGWLVGGATRRPVPTSTTP